MGWRNPDWFWSRTERDGDCLVWRGYRMKNGYGVIGEPKMLAHRAAWTITHGEIPAGLLVCHRCDNPPCVNPAHLFLGTMADNIRDCVAKNRHAAATKPHRIARGERNVFAKLTEADVALVRQLLATGARKSDIAARFGVCRGTIGHIAKGTTWRFVP